jgi:asparagine synthase (glutamine-hydrolysing)
MCGIAGEYQYNRGYASVSEIEQVMQRQVNRGPDGGGIYQLDYLALGHRRLKIFDVTERAAQPMIDPALGLVLVLNGAIYNFVELRDELKAKGYKFTSESDTEVLLKAYHAWGLKGISRLRGMFAFAIWERDTGKLLLARDRMGIKPLYFSHHTSGFKFASSVQALLEFDGIDTSIDKAALHYYLTFHAVPEPLTILSGVKKLQPGEIMTVNTDGKIERLDSWRLKLNEAEADRLRSEEEWLEATREALMMSVERQLRADVPVGILLSGGLDSSLLVAIDAGVCGKSIDTFSIGFERIGEEAGDEFIYSDQVASHFGTRHHKFFISNKQLADNLPACVAEMSEPMTSHDNIGFYLLSHEVAKHVKVVLSGQGADEIFAGYHWTQGITNERKSPEESAAVILDRLADHSITEYSALVKPEYRTENHAIAFLTQLCRQNGSEYPVDNLIVYESGFALANGPLGRVDNMAMSAGLEARVPFLDEEIVDMVSAMPLSYKMREGGKYILKQVGRQLLPDNIIERPKGYFPVPALKYLQGSMLELMHEVLSPKNVRERGIFEAETVRDMLAKPTEYFTHSGASKLWQIGLLEYWLQIQGL